MHLLFIIVSSCSDCRREMRQFSISRDMDQVTLCLPLIEKSLNIQRIQSTASHPQGCQGVSAGRTEQDRKVSRVEVKGDPRRNFPSSHCTLDRSKCSSTTGVGVTFNLGLVNTSKH